MICATFHCPGKCPRSNAALKGWVRNRFPRGGKGFEDLSSEEVVTGGFFGMKAADYCEGFGTWYAGDRRFKLIGDLE
jgi:hypothetical protein